VTETREDNVSLRKNHVTIGTIMRVIWITAQTRTHANRCLNHKVTDSKHKLS